MNTSDACVSTRSSKPQILANNCAIRSLRAAEVFTSDEPTVTWNISRCAFSTSMRTMQATWIPQQVSVLALNSVLCIRAPDTVGPPAAYLLLPPEMHHTQSTVLRWDRQHLSKSCQFKSQCFFSVSYSCVKR